MKPFSRHRGLVVPMPRSNVDTDAILPKQFMKSIERTGFGAHLFDGLRHLDPWQPGADGAGRRLDPDFVLNQPRYAGASILVAGENFGCGSSREHAPWALEQFGFRVLIAPSFADIFFNNCFKNGLLAIVLCEYDVESLMQDAIRHPGYALQVDLPRQTLTMPDGSSLRFEIQPQRKDLLLRGLDEVRATLELAAHIRDFEQRHRRQRPWLFSDVGDLQAGSG
ncbi:MAG: 3-isopropylmalate dehydratase small subunit [Burkholderiaceae bacterium]|nr:3-isopropylmalate dehydratase small subunit [Rhodocyclaceae bacterium]